MAMMNIRIYMQQNIWVIFIAETKMFGIFSKARKNIWDFFLTKTNNKSSPSGKAPTTPSLRSLKEYGVLERDETNTLPKCYQ